MRSFNQFVELTQERLQNAETQHTGILASSKVISYQKARIESILASLPPLVRWNYGFEPTPGSEEARLCEEFLVPRDWLAAETRSRTET